MPQIAETAVKTTTPPPKTLRVRMRILLRAKITNVIQTDLSESRQLTKDWDTDQPRKVIKKKKGTGATKRKVIRDTRLRIRI